MGVNEKMTALADEIRELSGVTPQLSIDAMTNKVDEANAEVNSQADLITQIKNVVDSLPNAGSTGEDVTAETNVYTEKITQLTTAVTALENELAGKASGGSGSGIETCTLEFTGNSLAGIAYGQASYLTFENGAITPHMVYNLQNLPTTISNCITNSLLVVFNDLPRYTFSPEIGCERFVVDSAPMWYYKLTATNGQTARINIIYNDF